MPQSTNRRHPPNAPGKANPALSREEGSFASALLKPQSIAFNALRESASEFGDRGSAFAPPPLPPLLSVALADAAPDFPPLFSDSGGMFSARLSLELEVLDDDDDGCCF